MLSLQSNGRVFSFGPRAMRAVFMSLVMFLVACHSTTESLVPPVAGAVATRALNVSSGPPSNTSQRIAVTVGMVNAGNLTSEGTSDWTHYGDASNPSDVTRKSGVTAAISPVRTGSGTPTTYVGDRRNLAWSDGTPITSSTGSSTGIALGAIGSAFSFDVPADANPKRVRIFLGGTAARATLRAHLSDNSSPDFVYSSAAVGGAFDADFTITYQAATSSAKLTLTWTLASATGSASRLTVSGIGYVADASETAAANVRTASGGTVMLPSGAFVSFGPSVLPADEYVTIKRSPYAADSVPDSKFSSIGSELTVSFAPFKAGAAMSAPLGSGSAPKATTAASGTIVVGGSEAQFGGALGAGTIESAVFRVAVDLGTATMRATGMLISRLVTAGINSAFGVGKTVKFFVIQKAVASSQFYHGIEYFDYQKNVWVCATPSYTIVPYHALLLLHGVNTNAEASFPPQIVHDLIDNQAYDAVIAESYDWALTADSVAPAIANDVNSLTPGLDNLDVIAHSYGTNRSDGRDPAVDEGDCGQFRRDRRTARGIVLARQPALGRALRCERSGGDGCGCRRNGLGADD